MTGITFTIAAVFVLALTLSSAIYLTMRDLFSIIESSVPKDFD